MEGVAILVVEIENPAQFGRDDFLVVDEGANPSIDKIFINRDAQEDVAENFQHISAKISNACVNFFYLVEMSLSRLRLAEYGIACRVEVFKLSVGRGEDRLK